MENLDGPSGISGDPMKKWYKSKTLWINAIAAVAFFVQAQFGFVVSLEYQAFVLAIVNLILRWITKEGIA